MSDQMSPQILGLTAQIVSAHVSNNPMESGALPSLIEAVYHSLSTADRELAPPEAATATPAVSLKKSVFPGYLVCLEDGKRLKMLKRHLHTSFGLTPDAYRAKWGLPASYPMVAPNYAAKRSGLARQIGLGRKSALASAEMVEPEVMKRPARRDHGSKA